MGLIHQFAVIPYSYSNSIVLPEMASVSISDTIIQYIGDSLEWIHTTWNGRRIQNGISYYGFSFIEDNEIIKLRNIIKQWATLFRLSPDEFYLTGNFQPEENQYEKVLVKRTETVNVLDLLVHICEKAITEKARVLHNGI